MKLYKLWTHQPTFSDEAIVFNPKDFPHIKVGDVVSIHNPETDYSPLLVQVRSLSETFQQKDVISISQAIASIFHLRMYNEVYINIVNSKDVALDLVELTYREQYFSRADMWRMKKSLTNCCLYMTQKVTYAEMRVQVHELWSKGDKVTCGYVTEDTRVTYRSSTAQVHIFVQMSCEMWEFDNYGDLYFEKAVDGFLIDLFSEWKEKGCNHDVTITLFSRTFYEAKSIEEFPMYMRECVQKHHTGWYYEDFYRVVEQNERYEDWTKTLVELRRLFQEYHARVIQYHQTTAPEGITVPRAWNSTAAEGNFLEVLNMSLNGDVSMLQQLYGLQSVYEKYFLDRCFDRTGKLSIVITPGPGVFTVDRQLASITKHRTIDCGNSSDIVCMGEQPLHVVPLFKFYNKQTSRVANDENDYNIPHWINHSFYTSRSQAHKMSRGIFIPRIKIHQSVMEHQMSEERLGYKSGLGDEVPFVDYDEYDAQVFKLPSQTSINTSSHGTSQVNKPQRVPRLLFSDSVVDLLPEEDLEIIKDSAHSDGWCGKKLSEEFLPHSFSGHDSRGRFDLIDVRHVIGSLPSPVNFRRSYHVKQSLQAHQPRAALFNPFTPSRLRFKVTSNRRRWAHAFPTDPQGASVQLHHKTSGNFGTYDAMRTDSQLLDHISVTSRDTIQGDMRGTETRQPRVRKTSENSDMGDQGRIKSVMVSGTISSVSSGSTDSLREGLSDLRSEREPSVGLLTTSSTTAIGTRNIKKVSSSGTLSQTMMDSSYNSAGVNVGSHNADRDGLQTSSSTHLLSVGHGIYCRSLSGGGRDLSALGQGVRDFKLFIPVNEGQALWQTSPLGQVATSRKLAVAVTPTAKNPEGINWMWGMSGEQEWTPEIETGSFGTRTRSSGYHSHSATATYRDSSSSTHREFAGSMHSGIGVGEVSHMCVWGITGEQEWTPEIKTGVDWKSMTLPASLPISTDFFPDKRSLENDYVFHNYTLLPDDINTDMGSDASKLLSTVQVYKEMVAQRLAQGFQIVMIAKSTPTNSTSSLSSSPYQGSSLIRRAKEETTEEVIVSIGRIFHRLSLVGPKINVTTYWPRHPYEHMNYHYTYRFQVPDSGKYDVSWTDFIYTKLENYNWNYVDGYLYSKGNDDFSLVEHLKFWRSHLCLLPCSNPATRKIIEGDPMCRCDIYEERSLEEQEQHIINFLKLVEVLNKMRRPMPAKLTKKDMPRKASLTSPITIPNHDNPRDGRPSDMSTKVKAMGKVQDGTESPISQSLSTASFQTPISETTSKKQTFGGAHVDPHAQSHVGATAALGSSIVTDPATSSSSSLTIHSPSSDVVEAMLDPHGGLPFVKQQNQLGLPPLPNHCFVSQDAIAWTKLHVEGVKSDKEAMGFIQKILEEGYICHASGNIKHRFVQGFYLYALLDKDTMFNANTNFPFDWLEVVTHCNTSHDTLQKAYVFLEEELSESHIFEYPVLFESGTRGTHGYFTGFNIHKTVNVDVDYSHKSDRQEWGKACYHANYTPTAAFELTVQWLVATGCILGDLIMAWARKAHGYGFHLLPVPGDPFALPFTPCSDPLRGPIFVPLDIECLKSPGQHLFEDFLPDTREQRLIQFQSCILKRFGFMPARCEVKLTGHSAAEFSQPKFVHCTGGMFAMIPDTKTTSPRNVDGTHCNKVTVGSLDPTGHTDYIAMQSGVGSMTDSIDLLTTGFYQVGFLWTWNYMLAKRWRSSNTGDEHYQDKMLADFRNFCANSENRLVDYWNQCKDNHQAIKRPESNNEANYNGLQHDQQHPRQDIHSHIEDAAPT